MTDSVALDASHKERLLHLMRLRITMLVRPKGINLVITMMMMRKTNEFCGFQISACYLIKFALGRAMWQFLWSPKLMTK